MDMDNNLWHPHYFQGCGSSRIFFVSASSST